MKKGKAEKLPPVKIEKNVPFQENIRQKSGILQHYYEQIKDMEIGDSFLLKGHYSLSDKVAAAFRLRGWKAAKRQQEKSKDGVWTFRIWRVK